MDQGNITCDSSILNQFFDRELGSEESAKMSGHIEHCRTCKQELRDNRFVSSLLKAGVEQEIARVNLQEVEERVTALIRSKKRLWWVHLKSLCLSKKLYVPAAAVTAMLVMFFHLARTPTPASGPSAIIDSLQGDFASVMILETRKSRQTILWIQEASDLWDNGGDPVDQTGLGAFSTRYCLTLEKGWSGWRGTIADGINTC
jgi:hypothetical protein